MSIRLISANDVKAIICKHENGLIQRTIIYEIEKLNGCLASDEQMMQIIDNTELQLED